MPTLPDILARVRALLMDTASLTWTDAGLTEAVRLALGEYNLCAGPAAPAAIEGLDGALATTLPAFHAGALVWGAAGCAALARAVDRSESFQPAAQARDLNAWGTARLEEYRAMLAKAFPAGAARLAELRSSPNPAWGTWGD